MPRVTAADRPVRAPARTPAKAPAPLQAKRPSRLALLWRRQRRLLRPAAWAVVALLAIGTVFSFARTVQPAAPSPPGARRSAASTGLLVTDIQVEGREKTPDAMLRAALGVSRGDPLLGFSLEAARTRIESLTWVHRATVERRLPGTIVVTLQERPALRRLADRRQIPC